MAVKIKGTIVSNDDKWIYDWFEYDATCPRDVEKALAEETGKEVVIEVNSGGGDVFAGNEINYLISQDRRHTKCSITGLAASAATIICCGADEVEAVPGAQYMIHNVTSSQSGDYNAMDKMSQILKNANVSITNIYRLKTGMSEQELLDLMNEETWMDAKKAKELGFIDSIIGDNGMLTNSKPFSIYNGVANIISDEVKSKIRNAIKKPESEEENADKAFLIAKEQLNLLKMKGEIKHV